MEKESLGMRLLQGGRGMLQPIRSVKRAFLLPICWILLQLMIFTKWSLKQWPDWPAGWSASTVHMHMHGVYVPNKGAWPNACWCDCSRYCMLLSSKRHICTFWRAWESNVDRFQLTLQCSNSWLARECFDICVVQGQSSIMHFYTNASNSECSGQQNSIRLLANIGL